MHILHTTKATGTKMIMQILLFSTKVFCVVNIPSRLEVLANDRNLENIQPCYME